MKDDDDDDDEKEDATEDPPAQIWIGSRNRCVAKNPAEESDCIAFNIRVSTFNATQHNYQQQRLQINTSFPEVRV